MPKNKSRSRSFSRQRSGSKTLQRNLIIMVVIVVAVVVVVAFLANQNSVSDVYFAARESGNPNAKVIVQEFSDFQCPACGIFANTAEIRLREEYINPGRIRFIFRVWPIVGNESTWAGHAALCAGDQNMFWEYHDLLFQNQYGENQGTFSQGRLQAFAVQLNLDSLQFTQCLENQPHADVIRADSQLANRANLQGTPTFFVNGVMASGPGADFQWLFDAIDRALLTTGG